MITTLTCNACSTPISPTGTRVICRACANYDLCSNCHTLGRFSDSHEVQHETLVLYPPTSISRDYHVPPAPPPPLPPRSDNSGEIKFNPHPRPAPLAARTPTAANKLLSSSNAPTKRLKDLSDAVFAYLNKTYPSENQHLLNPSQLSSFYELIGRQSEETFFTLWVSAMNALECSLDNIDPEVAYLYDRLGIEYSLITRAGEGVPLVAINSMPVLSHHGFRQLLVCDILEDPGCAHSSFNRLVHLAIVDDSGRAFEEMPRGMFPAEPDPAFAVKVAAVSEELSERAGALIVRLKNEREEEDQKERALAEQEEMAQMQNAATLAQIEQAKWTLAQQEIARMEAQTEYAAAMAVLEAQAACNTALCATISQSFANI